MAFHILIIFVLVSSVWGHRTPAYSHESHTNLKNPNWMSQIPNDTFISDISIPGTHETLSSGHGGPIAECQTISLKSQLSAGIRALDIRCRHIQDTFAIHHGLVFLDMFFGDVLNELKEFLESNPSEVILMRLKEEYTPFNNTRSFQDTLTQYLESYPNLFWKLSNSDIPLLKSVRGNVVLLGDFANATKFGLNYDDWFTFRIQDHYVLTSDWDLYPKWNLVKDHLQRADESYKMQRAFYINFLSGSTGTFPYFVSSGHVTSSSSSPRLSTGFTTLTSRDKYPDFPRLDCVLSVCTISFEGTNVLTYNFLRSNRDLRFVGVIMADFPGDGLIQEIIQLNHRHPNIEQIPLRHLMPWIFTLVLMIFFLLGVYKAIHYLQLDFRRASLRFHNTGKAGDKENIIYISTDEEKKF